MRTPTMSLYEIESQLGPRGTLEVRTSGPDANRDLVRKWLVALGLSSAAACTLTTKELEQAYNAFNDTPTETLGKLRAQPVDPQTEPQTEPRRDQFGALVDAALTHDPGTAIEQAIRLIAESVTPKAPALDENRVRKIVHEEASKFESPVTKIEIINGKDSHIIPAGLHHKQFEIALRVLTAGVNLAMVGPAGSGKTTAAEQVAQALQRPFFLEGAISSVHQLLGYTDVERKYHRTPTRDACELGGLICYDEFDASIDAAAPLVLNSLLSNGLVTFPDQTKPIKKHENFACIVTMNTFGLGADRSYVGRTQMDAATLDRFYFLGWDYDAELERLAAGGSVKRQSPVICEPADITPDQWVDRVQAIRHAIASEKDRMIVSPRASIMGIRLFQAGLSIEQVEQGLVWKGCNAETRARIEQRARGA